MSQDMTPRTVVAGSLAIFAAIAFVMVFWPYATQDATPSGTFRRRTAGEDAGRAIYMANGCVYCHTQSVRAFDWGADRIAEAGDYVADRPILLGSERTGLDLSQQGGEHPDDWHMAHFINPRHTRGNSIMPPFAHLGADDIRRLTGYVQSLGGSAADRRVERQSRWKTQVTAAYQAGPEHNVRWLAEQIPEGWRHLPNPYPTTDAGLARGRKIYQDFCLGCHGPIGDGMGPAQPHLYPPPLNFTILKSREISGGILYYQIMNGITGSAMPYFKADLESEKIWEVGNFVAVNFIGHSDANADPRGIDAANEP